MTDRSTYELFSPESIGRETPEFVLGKHSGTAVLQHLLQKKGLTINKTEAALLLPRTRELAQSKKAPLSLEELLQIYRDTFLKETTICSVD